MSAVPVWSCAFGEAKEAGAAPLNALTVGTKFTLNCHGDIAVAWSAEPPAIRFAEGKAGQAMEHSLVILKVIRQEPQAADYVVTSYQPGDHKPEFFRVLQGEQGFEVLKPQWTVKSVLPPNPQQPPQPIPSFGPFGLALPLWVTLLAGGVLLGLTAWLVRRMRRASQRRRMLEDLKLHATVLEPIHQFYKDARQIRTKLNQVKPQEDLKPLAADLEREFKLYILRKYQVPALEWSTRATLGDIAKRHGATYKRAGDALKKTLRELERLQGQKDLQLPDLEQMHRMSLDTAERLESAEAKT